MTVGPAAHDRGVARPLRTGTGATPREQSKAGVFDRGEAHRRIAVEAPRARDRAQRCRRVSRRPRRRRPTTAIGEHARRATPDGRAMGSRGCPTSYRHGRSSRRDRCPRTASEQSGRRMRRARRQDVGRAVAHVPAVFAGVRCGVGRRSSRSGRGAVRARRCAPATRFPFRTRRRDIRDQPWRKTNDTRVGPPVVGLLAERPQMPPPAGPS